MKKRLISGLIIALTFAMTSCGDTTVGASSDAYSEVKTEYDRAPAAADEDFIFDEAPAADGSVDGFYMQNDYANEKDADDDDRESVSPVEEEEKEIVNIELEWTEHTITVNDTYGKGYEIKEILRISPWISGDKTDVLEAYWKDIVQDSFPDISQYTKGNPAFGTGEPGDEYYYYIATLSAENESSGFDLSSDKPANVLFYLNMCDENGKAIPSIGLFYFSNGPKAIYGATRITYADGSAHPNFDITSNQWGELPIVMRVWNEKTPANPEGAYDMSKVTFFLSQNVHDDTKSEDFFLPVYSD